MTHPAQIQAIFRARFGERPLLVRSPGRINLLGEHTDYNQGGVLPAAIDRSIWLALALRPGRRCRLVALDLGQEHAADLTALTPSGRGWPDHLLGVVDQFHRLGHPVDGFDCVFGGDIPIGAGLSSSAALEAGLAFALDRLHGWGLDRLTLARLAQRAEHQFVGVQCGIMDPYANLFGQPGHVLWLDCRSLEHTPLPLDPAAASLVLFPTSVSHSLAASEYNRRRAECAQGVAVIRRRHPEVASLRDVTPDVLADCRRELDPVVFRRCAYVVGENERLTRAVVALRRGDLPELGGLMGETHRGLSQDYQVSCPELDCLVELVADDPGVYGARLMGGGFGGCTLNLVQPGVVDRLRERVGAPYRERFGREPVPFVVTPAAGTSVVENG